MVLMVRMSMIQDAAVRQAWILPHTISPERGQQGEHTLRRPAAYETQDAFRLVRVDVQRSAGSSEGDIEIRSLLGLLAACKKHGVLVFSVTCCGEI